MPNRPEWQFVNLANSSFSLVQLSLYDVLPANIVEYCINHAEAKVCSQSLLNRFWLTDGARSQVVFTSPSHITTLLKIADKIPAIKLIISVDKLAAMHCASCTPLTRSHSFSDIDLVNGGKPYGSVSKKAALQDWASTKGITIMDLAERRSNPATKCSMLTCRNSRGYW